jgi:hypothetical protein
MPRPSLVFVIVILTVWLGGCYSTSSYDGDGTLNETTDGGYFYKLSLGRLDLSMEGKSTYQLKGLPEETFIIGLYVVRLTSDSVRIIETKPLKPAIKLRLLNERDEVVIDEYAGLDRWVWSGGRDVTCCSFVYLRGRSVEIPTGGGGVRVERTDEGADDGWGTYFVPRRNGVYTLDVRVVTPDPHASQFRVELIAYGGQRFYL